MNVELGCDRHFANYALKKRRIRKSRNNLGVTAWLLALGLGFLAGCTNTKHGSKAEPPAVPLVWPSQPDAPRIAYVQAIAWPADLGIKSSALSRFGHWLTGSEKGNERFIKPFGIALDENDNLCLTDTGANAVVYVDRAKKKWQRWDKVGKQRLVAPVAVVKRHGTIYVADSGLACVLALDENGKLLRQITNHLERPSGLALANEQLLVADSQRHCVVVFDLLGNYQSEFGRRGTGPGQFNFPTHLAADGAGNLFVTDSMNSRVQMMDAKGVFKSQMGGMGDSPGQFGRPKGLALDSFGHVYVLDALFDNLQVFDPAGPLLLSLGSTGAQLGEFWLPNGIAISRNNEIFVTDSYNHRIQVFKYIGTQ
jgi:sugar lactone lactonase YvrE